MNAMMKNEMAKNLFKQQVRELEAQGFTKVCSVMSDSAGSPSNGVWFTNGDKRARLAGGKVTIGSKEFFDQEKQDYIDFRAVFKGMTLAI